MKPTPFLLHCVLVACAFGTVSSCQSAYYSTMEAFGTAKRDILVDRVGDARDEQTQAKQEFKDALTRFREVTNFKGGELEEKYNALKEEYDNCAYRAQKVSERIEGIEDVSQAMFDEWTDELAEYTNQDLRRASESQLHETQRGYDKMVGVMKRAEKSMRSVLATFKDQTLYLKHNLNAQAISSLQGQVTAIETDVAKLIEDMEASIDEANKFIDSMPKS